MFENEERRITRVQGKRAAKWKQGYVLPFYHDSVSIVQGHNGPYSNFAYQVTGPCFNMYVDDRYCIDFRLPFGTPVLAARSGTIERIVDTHNLYYDGPHFSIGIRVQPNVIMMRHADDTFTAYSCLMEESAEVPTGTWVRAGQMIARTGKTGWIGGVPHLHFCAFDIINGERHTFPAFFDNYQGALEHKKLSH